MNNFSKWWASLPTIYFYIKPFMLKPFTILFFFLYSTNGFTQNIDSATKLNIQYTAVIDFSDAAINSIAALNSLIKKENYRNKIASFNNPTSNDLGFNLQVEINTALKPLLEKAKHVNSNKFVDIIGSLVGNQGKNGLTKSLIPTTSIFSTLTSLVGNLTINEKRITRNDLDSFIINISKYFGQYEKLNRVNQQFDTKIDKIDYRLQELQTDLKEFLIDLIVASQPHLIRKNLKSLNIEELLLKHLYKPEIENQINTSTNNLYFPTDAIKTAKDITSAIQKIFAEYQKFTQRIITTLKIF